MLEVWTLIALTNPDDRTYVIRAVLKGETLTTFDSALQERSKDADGKDVKLNMTILKEAADEVSKTIPPTELWRSRSSG